MKGQLKTTDKIILLILPLFYTVPLLVWSVWVGSVELLLVYAGLTTFLVVTVDVLIKNYQLKHLPH